MSISNIITYKDAGVDIRTADEFVERIKDKVKSTYDDRVMQGVGGFAALYKMPGGKLLASGTDSVGTKVKLAQALNKHDTIGIDVVAMCVNDVICTGARPLFFLDYIGTGKLTLDTTVALVDGVVAGCKGSELALIGGETAEMPGVYPEGEYDLAGFCVGEVDEKDLIDGSCVKEGDTLIALPSSGLHSNGFSLVRKLINPEETDLMEEALTPTRLYWPVIKDLLPLVSGLANITGGGIGNVPRMNSAFDYKIEYLPEMDEIPPIFAKMADRCGMEGKDLYETWNMGIGFVIATSEPEKVAMRLNADKEPFWTIGRVEKGQGRVVVRSMKYSFEC
ncbi:MAG: phosphoribosylformylglycinamidine cyclo-ligase [Alphaproteobacteria bacterium]|nr:phosphoribosylformylglycinamidine cyclo-ligase [Alphaproteobacteria bacterium]